MLAVGQRVFVACPEGGPTRVALTDDTGSTTIASLADGTEVDIVAWRPRGSSTRYCVRSPRDGFEGWLPAANLRGSHARVAPAPAASPVRAAPAPTPIAPRRADVDGKRRFGQRSG